PGLADGDDRGPAGARTAERARADGAPRGARRGDRPPARAREARGHALLLRGADSSRDRRGARRDRVARLAAAHEGDPAAESEARRFACQAISRWLTGLCYILCVMDRVGVRELRQNLSVYLRRVKAGDRL